MYTNITTRVEQKFVIQIYINVNCKCNICDIGHKKKVVYWNSGLGEMADIVSQD